MDILFHWIQHIILQEHFNVFWKAGPTNLGDYHSKNHPTPHHIQVRHTNLHEPHNLQNTLQGCVNTPNRYTTGASLGLRKCQINNHKQGGNNQFSNDVWQIH